MSEQTLDNMLSSLSAVLDPVRGKDESFEVYQQRRKNGNKLSKVMRKGIMVHTSKWYTVEKDKEGKDVVKAHHKTFVKPTEE